MTNWGEKLEHFLDFIMPYTLILLLFIIICGFFFKHFYETYHVFFVWGDWFVLGVFVLDLIFKYKKAKNIPNFLKTSWLDIIAVFPFFLVFRVFETMGLIRGIVETGQEAQLLFHAGVEVQKEIKGAAAIGQEIKLAAQLEKEARVIKQIDVIAQEGARSEKMARFLRPIFRSPRLFQGIKFYEKPKKNSQ